MGHELEQGSAGHQLDQGLGLGNGERVQLAAEPLQRLPVVVGDPGNQRRRGLRPVALRPTAVHPGRTLRDQSLERTVGVGPGQPRGAGDGVTGAGAAGEQDLVYEAFGGGKAEPGEVWHGRSMGDYDLPCKDARYT